MKTIDIKYGIFNVENMFFDTLNAAIEFCEANLFMYQLTDNVKKWQAVYHYAA